MSGGGGDGSDISQHRNEEKCAAHPARWPPRGPRGPAWAPRQTDSPPASGPTPGPPPPGRPQQRPQQLPHSPTLKPAGMEPSASTSRQGKKPLYSVRGRPFPGGSGPEAGGGARPGGGRVGLPLHVPHEAPLLHPPRLLQLLDALRQLAAGPAPPQPAASGAFRCVAAEEARGPRASAGVHAGARQR